MTMEQRLRDRFGVVAMRATDEGFSDDVINQVVQCVGVYEAELLRLGERAALWFADGTRTDEPLDMETAVKCIDGALGALEASRPISAPISYVPVAWKDADL